MEKPPRYVSQEDYSKVCLFVVPYMTLNKSHVHDL